MKRICIYPADISMLTGRSDSYSRRLLRNIRKDLNKKPRQLISLQEFCDYTGLSIQEIDHLFK